MIICNKCKKEIEKPDCHCSGCCGCWNDGICKLDFCDDCQEEESDSWEERMKERRLERVEEQIKDWKKKFNRE